MALSAKKKDMNIDKLTINRQSFARVRLQLKFAFILWSLDVYYMYSDAF